MVFGVSSLVWSEFILNFVIFSSFQLELDRSILFIQVQGQKSESNFKGTRTMADFDNHLDFDQY